MMDKIMYKVLIADDEFWIREKIKNMIEWSNYSLELLEPAKDGEDVLNKIEEYRPDILITDINMPFINGVELVRLIKEKYPDKEVSTMNKYQIILKTSEDGTDLSKANKYTLENEDGYISVFKYNKEGKKELVEKTSIQIKSLPKSVQEELKDAIVLDNEDDAYSRLEDFGS